MRSLNPMRFFRALSRRSGPPPAVRIRHLQPATRNPLSEPTVYADAALSRLLTAFDRRASDLELALAEYARARRNAGVQPETVLVEFKRVLRRAIGIDPARPRLTGRLIELYFAA